MQFKYLPNILSFSRILVTPFFIIIMLKNTIFYKLCSLFIFFIGSFSDFLDGYLARKYNNISTIGKYIDPLADKILVLSGFYILYLYYPGVIKLWMVSLIFFRDISVTILRNYLINNNMEVKTSFFAKSKTLLQIIVIHIFLIFHIYNPLYLVNYDFFYLLMMTTVLITILSAFPYFRALSSNENY